MVIHSSLLGNSLSTATNYFLNIRPSSQYYKTLLGIIYATSGIFPYGFDWIYTDSDVIMSKKVL